MGTPHPAPQHSKASFCFMRNALKIYLNLFHFPPNELHRTWPKCSLVVFVNVNGRGSSSSDVELP